VRPPRRIVGAHEKNASGLPTAERPEGRWTEPRLQRVGDIARGLVAEHRASSERHRSGPDHQQRAGDQEGETFGVDQL
jgi:hypothetical protein